MIEGLQYFHFLRPAWLLAIPVLAVLWWRIRPRRTAAPVTADVIAPHLAEALRVGSAGRRRFWPIDGVALGGVLLALAAAGPAWSRLPSPLVADTAPLVVALKVAGSMAQTDLAPSRLDRARFKVLDLVEARAGAPTALIAYAGTAHRVAPLTEDPNILRPLLESLAPEVMPVPGDDAAAALDLALEVLATAETQGAVLFVLDDLNPGAVEAFNAPRDPPRPPVVVLVAAPGSVSLPQLDRIEGATVVRLTADDTDIGRIERRVRAAHAAALAGDERLAWNDRGWLLAWPVALLSLFWFRRGWTMRWALVAMLLVAQAPGSARAEGWVDWFLTPDQQGMRAYRDKQYARAAELFVDPMWKGQALLRAGQYEAAAELFAGLDTAEAAFAEGLARIRNRQYRPGVRAYETALERRPDFPEARINLEIARAIVDYVETAQEQSDTGEESGIGADEIVFDNESGKGADTQIEAPDEDAPPLSADQWMRGIDTEMGDFLRSRFLLENQGRAR